MHVKFSQLNINIIFTAVHHFRFLLANVSVFFCFFLSVIFLAALQFTDLFFLLLSPTDPPHKKNPSVMWLVKLVTKWSLPKHLQLYVCEVSVAQEIEHLSANPSPMQSTGRIATSGQESESQGALYGSSIVVWVFLWMLLKSRRYLARPIYLFMPYCSSLLYYFVTWNTMKWSIFFLQSWFCVSKQ